MAEKKPEWVKMKPSEVEALVIELAKKGETPEKIGLILRDTHGIPKIKLVGKKIMQIINESKVSILSQKERLQKKMTAIETHIAKNKHDYTAQRSLGKKLWVARKL
jgi:small subunit ribosomal protein S15